MKSHEHIERLKKETWLKYLAISDNNFVNIERIDSLKEITGKETLNYVLKTLKILENNKNEIAKYNYDIVKNVLQWSEVAKGGTLYYRNQWINKKYKLDIHNIGSSQIYAEHFNINIKEHKIIHTLIKTHGLIGQNIRGEVSIEKNLEIRNLFSLISKTDLYEILYVLNKCIICGISDELWQNVKANVVSIIEYIIYDKPYNKFLKKRLRNLCGDNRRIDKDCKTFFYDQIFPYFELWYFNPALANFKLEEIEFIFKEILQYQNINNISHLNFKPLMDNLYYDYKNKKSINIYKKRVIEKYITDKNNQHVELYLEQKNDILYIDFKFSSACEKLIDFCVEAERSGILTYNKSITILFDMFGFRHDEFDRLNNENKYLHTMNNSANSTKEEIIEYIVGDTIIDVGSGGGILLNLLEQKYPNKNIIGTDISSNVVDFLLNKKQEENHTWDVITHNFVDNELKNLNPDTIIFSSILHEIYSYTETNEGKFNLDSVKQALTNAYNSLNKGGRIIIRDGIKTDSCEELTIKFYNKEDVTFFKNFVNDFKGLQDITNKNIKIKHDIISSDINYMREFLFTYTWGKESYAHEINEQFGYFTLSEFITFIEKLGGKIIIAKSFLEPGYEEHLLKKVKILNNKKIPHSNCIIVVEKQ